MNSAAMTSESKVERTERLREQRCVQCGERLDGRSARPTCHRPLCVDCAFEDLPHTD